MAEVAALVSRLLQVVALLFAGATGSLFAAAADYQGKRVVSIAFDPALQPLPDDELRNMLSVKQGEPLDLSNLREAIVRLYATGRYEDIAADAQLADGGVALRFQTRTTWFVGQVSVEGVPEPPNRGQLINATRLQLGREYNEQTAEVAMTNIREVLRDNGFYEASVERFLIYQPAFAQVNVIFQVTPGERARFSTPEVTGVPEEAVRRVVKATGWKRRWPLPGWRTVTAQRLQRGLEKIRGSYQKREFLLNSVALEELEYQLETQTVVPKMVIEQGPRVEVTTNGADVSRKRLKQLVPVFQEQSVDRDLLVEGSRNIAEHLQAKGYFDAKVEFTQNDVSADLQQIEYLIDPGERHKLVRLEVEGNQYFDDATISERLATQPATTIRYRNGRYSEALLNGDLSGIASLYRSNGFRDVQVKATTEPADPENPLEVAVTIHITEGPQWFVSDLLLEGVSQELEPDVYSLIGASGGQPFSLSSIMTDRDNVLDFYYNNGYPDASFDWIITEDPDSHQVSLAIRILEGERQYVRASLIGGLEDTSADLVYSRIRIEPGSALSQSEIVESQRRLYDLGIFARVDTAIQNPDGVETNKYVLHQFEEARKWSLNFGLGAQIARIGSGTPDFDNPAGSAGFSPRVSFGASRSNIFGVGHTTSLQTRISETRQRGLINYLAPQFKGRENISLSVTGLYDFSRDINTFESTRWEGSLQFSNQLSRANAAQLRYTFRRVKTGNLAIDPDLVPIFAQSARVGLVASGFIQDKRDDVLDSRRGYYNAVDFGIATKAFGSQTEYTRLVGRNSTYHQLKSDLVLARSLTVGWMANTANDMLAKPIPLPELFFSGGASSHRGFPDNQAGPRDSETGFVIGGQAVFMHNTELRFPLIGDNLGGVLFHDAGNVYSTFGDVSFRVKQRDRTDFDYMVHAFGFGIRYRTPIGPVRLDLAYSPNSTRFFGFQGTREDLIGGGGEKTNRRISQFQFFFSIGQTF